MKSGRFAGMARLRRRTYLSLLLGLAAAMVLVNCNGGGGGSGATTSSSDSSGSAPRLELDPSSGAVTVGQSLEFRVLRIDAQGRSEDVSSKANWSSSNPSVLSGGASGNASWVARGESQGFASVTASISGLSASAPVSVTTGEAGVGLSPLKVNPTRPWYFVDAADNPVYLTGAHTWMNLQDAGLTDPPPRFDYEAYLDFLTQRHLNFFRLWVWEQAKWTAEIQSDYWISPLPYDRTGPGNALDGKPKFDLNKFNQTYFDRLRSRVQAAGARGIYVSVMLFNGWSIRRVGPSLNNPWKGHPFNAANNINGIDGDPNGDGQGNEAHTLEVPAVTAIQEAYIRKVVDSVGDLNNVLFEISNESHAQSMPWQYHMLDYIKSYLASKSEDRPVGLTSVWPGGSNTDLFESNADWVSPNNGGDGAMGNPYPAFPGKVVIYDTDHLCGVCGNVAWVWRSFTRGLNPILMDPYDGKAVGQGANDADYRDPVWADIRRNLGYTRLLAERLNLAHIRPRPDLASTGYCLSGVDAGDSEFVVFSSGEGQFEVDLSDAQGSLASEWLDPATGQVIIGDPVQAGQSASFTVPFNGSAVLYLHP